MRYYLKTLDTRVVLLCADHGMTVCPFLFESLERENAGCGSWCPLFDVVDVKSEEGYACLVHLHCGAGTRTIGIDAYEPEEKGETS